MLVRSLASFRSLVPRGGIVRFSSTVNSNLTAQKEAMSLDEALYFAQVNGISTVKELQQQIMFSPSFSPNKSPFLIENFYDTLESTEPEDPLEIPPEMDDISRLQQETASEATSFTGASDEQIHNLLRQTFNPNLLPTFKHKAPNKEEREFLIESEGFGTRRRARANVTIRRGTGLITWVDPKGSTTGIMRTRIPLSINLYARFEMLQPFFETGTCGLYDVFIEARGGGVVGQAYAARLAIARALLKACPETYHDLQKDGMLVEDLRQMMPKMLGRYSARARNNWSKR